MWRLSSAVQQQGSLHASDASTVCRAGECTDDVVKEKIRLLRALNVIGLQEARLLLYLAKVLAARSALAFVTASALAECRATHDRHRITQQQGEEVLVELKPFEAPPLMMAIAGVLVSTTKEELVRQRASHPVLTSSQLPTALPLKRMLE